MCPVPCPRPYARHDAYDRRLSTHQLNDWLARVSARVPPPRSGDRTVRVRYVTQVSYGRRLIGHLYHPFMNYQMPAHCFTDADPRRKRLLGFKPSGAYG